MKKTRLGYQFDHNVYIGYQVNDNRVVTVKELNNISTAAVSVAGSVADLLQREIDELRIEVEGLLVFESRSEFPETGESTSLYIATDESKIYYWNGSAYVALTIDLSNYYTKSEIDAFIDWLDARITALEAMHADAYILDCGNAFTNIPDPD